MSPSNLTMPTKRKKKREMTRARASLTMGKKGRGRGRESLGRLMVAASAYRSALRKLIQPLAFPTFLIHFNRYCCRCCCFSLLLLLSILLLFRQNLSPLLSIGILILILVLILRFSLRLSKTCCRKRLAKVGDKTRPE